MIVGLYNILREKRIHNPEEWGGTPLFGQGMYVPLNSVWFSGYTISLFNMLNRLSFWTAKPYKELKVGDAWSRCTNNVISKKSNSLYVS